MKDTPHSYFLPHLDGLRGLAALVVFFGHSASSFFPNITGGAYRILNISMPDFSDSAVCIFFVLSGYVVSMLSMRSQESLIAISARRYLRLAGPALGSCLLSAWLLKHHLYFNQSVVAMNSSYWLKHWFLFEGSYLSAFREGLIGIFQNTYSIYNSYNSSLWTMYVELWGSFGIFLLYYLIKNNYLRLSLLLLVCFVLAFIYQRHDFFCFIAGAVSFNLHQLFNFKHKNSWVIMAMAVGMILCSFPKIADLYYFVPSWFHAMGSILIIYHLHYSAMFKEFLSRGIFRWLGKISFSLYLIHILIICSIGAGLIIILHSVFTYYQSVFLAIAISCIISLSLAVVYTKIVDTLFIHLGKKLSKKIDYYLFKVMNRPLRSFILYAFKKQPL